MRMQLGLRAPVLTQIIWHSAAARAAWAEVLNEIGREWPRAERLSVVKGIRRATRQVLKRGVEFDRVEAWARNEGLFVDIWKAVGNFAGFTHHYPEGDDQYVAVIASDREALIDHEKYLGYPPCCEQAFARWFPAIADPMWMWAGECADIKASPFANPLLRYVNARFAPHIPCAPDCAASIELGHKMSALMSDSTAKALYWLLNDPIEWDCYRGLAVVTTQHFRLLVGSDPLQQRYRVKVNHEQRIAVACAD